MLISLSITTSDLVEVFHVPILQMQMKNGIIAFTKTLLMN